MVGTSLQLKLSAVYTLKVGLSENETLVLVCRIFDFRAEKDGPLKLAARTQNCHVLFDAGEVVFLHINKLYNNPSCEDTSPGNAADSNKKN